MRVFMVVLALALTPLAVGVSQQRGPSGGGAHGKAWSRMKCKKVERQIARLGRQEARNDAREAKGKEPKEIKQRNVNAEGCATEPPVELPPVGCVVKAAAGGTGVIAGNVYDNAYPWPPIADWCVRVSGPASATALTDVNGNYTFDNLPAGNYTVCATVQTGWSQTFPDAGTACPDGSFGYTFQVGSGAVMDGIFFGNNKTS